MKQAYRRVNSVAGIIPIKKLVLVMIELPPKEMPCGELTLHDGHQMLSDLPDCGMVVTLGAGQASRSFDIDRGAFMFATTTEAFEASRRVDEQRSSRDQANIGVTHVQGAMTILVPEVARQRTHSSFIGPRHGRWQVVQSPESCLWAASSGPGS